MRFDTSQQMKLGQHMKLAPRMIQSMEILQLPMMALQERIERELESNIALEQAEPGGELEALRLEREEDQRSDTAGEREMVVGDDSPTGSEDFERLSTLESTYGDAFEYSSAQFSRPQQSGERDRKMDAMANVAARGESLTDQLQHQWTFAEVDPDTAELGRRIIEYVDDDGLLRTDAETILDQNRNIPGVELTIDRIEKAISVLQHWLEPPGICARSTQESLLLQVDALEAESENPGNSRNGDDWSDVRLLIRDHFDDLLQNRLPRIAQEAEISLERIQAAIELMRRLNLSPGRDLVDAEVPPIIPDVVVEYDEQSDSYIAALTDGLLPVLRISQHYQQMSKDSSQPKETREFISNNVRNATWLIESINQRNNTVLRVVNVVLARQRDYFDSGEQYLKPLPMIEVADLLGIHVGTVSRAVADKWMQTPRGLVPLRRFFSGGTSTDTGRDMSWDAVKAILREIVEAEDKAHPLSDEALSQELKKRGIDIARRTVVKYRQQLDIPPARRRKTY